MKSNRKQFARALFACAAAIGASPLASMADEVRWIGGDKSGVINAMADTNNWDIGVAPTNETSHAFIIDQDGDCATWLSSTSRHALNGALTIGAVSSPTTTVHFSGNRSNPPHNDNPSVVSIGGTVSILGSNTTVRIDKGLMLSLGKEHNPILTLDPLARLCGDGIISVAHNSYVTQPYDFDNLQISYGRAGDHVYSIGGNVATRGRLAVTSSGGGATDRTATVKLNGFDFECGSVRLGVKDVHNEYAGDQSGLGAIDLGGGTLRVAGDIFFASSYDALQIDSTSPLTGSSRINSANGGVIELGGSFTNITTRFPKIWAIQDVDFTLNGSGAVQSFEALSADLGDAPAAAIENYCWRDITIAAGASVVLVDQYDNNTADHGAPEAVYCRNLTIEPGASLDLAGRKIYYYGSADIQGAVTQNGGAIAPVKASPIVAHAYAIGTNAPALGLGIWINGITAGDIDGDGIAEIFAFTIDEVVSDANGTEDDDQIHAFNYNNGALNSLPNYPASILGITPGVNIGNQTVFDAPIVDDIGDGFGKRFYYTVSGWSRYWSVGADPTAPRSHINENGHYGKSSVAIGDLDGDGVKEIAVAGRDGTANVRVYDMTTGARKWSRFLPAGNGNGIIGHVAMGDLDLDGSLEVVAVPTKSAGINHGIGAFRADGSDYYAPGASEPLTNMPFASAVSESYGTLSIANIDSDPWPEIIFCSVGNGFTALKQDGTVKFTAAGESNSFALFDLDGDGIYEILYGTRLYDGEGNVLDELPTLSRKFNPTIPAVLADLNGDQIPEAIYVLSLTGDVQANQGRYICVYDFVAQRVVPGFPVALKFPVKNPAFANSWQAGAFHHDSTSHILVGDFDNNGTWEIIVGTGFSLMQIDGTPNEELPCLNIIATPYRVSVPEGRTAEDYGWYSWKKNSRMDCKFPLYVPQGTLLIIR